MNSRGQRQNLVEWSPIEDELLADKSPASVLERSRVELEDVANSRIAVVGEAMLVSDRAEEPVEEDLGCREWVSKPMS